MISHRTIQKVETLHRMHYVEVVRPMFLNSAMRYHLQLPKCWVDFHHLGIVTVASRLDYESVQVISILVRASDGTDEGAARTTDQRFSVSVININDNKPQFSQEYYEAEIDENTTARQIVTTVSATDGDLSPYGEVR